MCSCAVHPANVVSTSEKIVCYIAKWLAMGWLPRQTKGLMIRAGKIDPGLGKYSGTLPQSLFLRKSVCQNIFFHCCAVQSTALLLRHNCPALHSSAAIFWHSSPAPRASQSYFLQAISFVVCNDKFLLESGNFITFSRKIHLRSSK